jgi:hypothetical protein
MARPYEDQEKEAQKHLLQQDYKKAIKEVNRLRKLLDEIGVLVD